MSRQTSMPRAEPPRISEEPPRLDKATLSSEPGIPPVQPRELAPIGPPLVISTPTAPPKPQETETQPPVLEQPLPEPPLHQPSQNPAALRRRTWLNLPWRAVAGTWEVLSVYVLLASIAAFPVLQLASLGYLLHSAGQLATGQSWRKCLPGSVVAGRITLFVLCAALSWLPVWLVTDLSYSAQLLQPGSLPALLWRVAAFTISIAWLGHVGWAAMRGGRWWHFIWPAPIRFVLNIFRPSTWKRASNQLFELVDSLRLPMLWWLGLRAAVGALLWSSIPVSLMIIGLRSDDGDGNAFAGLAGAVAMALVMLYLPFLQIQLATTGRFKELFNVTEVRRRFLAAPLAHAFALLVLCGLSIPLYLLRIEATPAELLWAPSLVFVLFMLPAKWLIGAAMGYADRRRKEADALPVPADWQAISKKEFLRRGRRSWWLRWPARGIALASVAIYVGSLYIAQLVAGQGAWVMYFQHAVLVPAPLISS